LKKIFIYSNSNFSSNKFRIALHDYINNHGISCVLKTGRPSFKGLFSRDSFLFERRLSPILDIISMIQICAILTCAKRGSEHVFFSAKLSFVSAISSLILTLLGFNRRLHFVIEGLGQLEFWGGTMILKLFIRFVLNTLVERGSKVSFLNPDDWTFFVLNGLKVSSNIMLAGPVGLPEDLIKSATIKGGRRLTKNVIRLVFCSRFIANKGILEFIEFCNEINFKKSALYLANGFDSLFEDKCASDIDKFVGHVYFNREFRDELRAGDVLFLLSSREGFPMIVQESLVLGVPVIAINVPGSNVAVLQNVNGVLIDNVTINHLKEALDIVEANYLRFSGNGRHLAASWFSQLHFINGAGINV